MTSIYTRFLALLPLGWVYIEPRWILETHPSIKQYIIAHVKTLVPVDIHQ
jgi:hypothetical protein